VRATDTGGNSTLSEPVVLEVVPDTFAPQLQTANVSEGASLYFVRSINLGFDEPINVGKLNATTVNLVKAGADGLFGTADDTQIAARIDSRAQGQQISIIPSDFLTQGSYRLTVSAAGVSDASGNALTDPIVRNFTIKAASQVKAANGLPEVPTAPSANPGQTVAIPVSFDPTTAKLRFNIIDSGGSRSTVFNDASRIDAAKGLAYFVVPFNAVSGDVTLYSVTGTTQTVPEDGVFPLQIVSVISDVQVESVAADGSSAQVLISGTGFVEGANSEYRFGTTTVLDSGNGTGPDVFDRYDYTIGQNFSNGYTRVTVPLSNGVFGGITIKTEGGTSATYGVGLTGVSATALSGTPADPAQPSANAGQSITITGSGLNTSTDVLYRWINMEGALQMGSLSPTTVTADGTSATLILPSNINGAFGLQVFGSSSQPMLQIVPTISSVDVQDRTVVFGSGFVEGGSTYTFAGASVTDTPALGNSADVYYSAYSAYNGSAYLDRGALPAHGLGNVTVTTAGGTSAAFAFNSVRVSVSGNALGDVAVDAAGKLWVNDMANPTHLLKIDPSTGSVLQTITMNADYDSYGGGYMANYAGLQVLSADMTLGTTVVPAGSLLVFNGYPYPGDRITAIDPISGAVIAGLTLDGNYDLVGGTYNPVNGHMYLTESNGPGHLWLGAANGGAQLVEYSVGSAGVLTELRRLDTRSQNINENEISGLSFDAAGNLWVSSTRGDIYKINTA
jgi:hypothetical protein